MDINQILVKLLNNIFSPNGSMIIFKLLSCHKMFVFEAYLLDCMFVGFGYAKTLRVGIERARAVSHPKGLAGYGVRGRWPPSWHDER